MTKINRDLSILVAATILLTLLMWLPHLLALPNFFNLDFSNGFLTVYRNYDGLEYVTIAKSWYQPEFITNLPVAQSPSYFAAHFPGYALFVGIFAIFLGYLKSMLFTTLLFTVLSACMFYQFVREFRLTSNPLILSLLFLVLPARWLIVHSVGSSEPTFIFFILLALYCFWKFELTARWRWIHFAGLAGLFAQLTRPPGILLFIAICIYIIWKIINRLPTVIPIRTRRMEMIHHRLFSLLGIKHKDSFSFPSTIAESIFSYHPLLLIPLGLLLMFIIFSINLHDFWAYFHSGDNIHLSFPPFQVFNRNGFWVGDIWLEDVIYIFILGFLGAITLFKKQLYPLAFFVFTYLIASIMVVHRDISRYTLPIVPFILIAFENVLVSKEFRLVIIIVALGIYLYAQNFILNNFAPIPNLGAFN
jgi:uncharacterized membrane protein YqaE (UPF0057 family)